MLVVAGAYRDADIAPLHSSSNSTEYPMCRHLPTCPTADAPDRDAACVVASHPEQGWSLLCNGVVCFDDLGELLPDGSSLPARRATPHGHHGAAA
jgi:Family of unknown function (DUF5999)